MEKGAGGEELLEVMESVFFGITDFLTAGAAEVTGNSWLRHTTIVFGVGWVLIQGAMRPGTQKVKVVRVAFLSLGGIF